jgi:hypothetical protein
MTGRKDAPVGMTDRRVAGMTDRRVAGMTDEALAGIIETIVAGRAPFFDCHPGLSGICDAASATPLAAGHGAGFTLEIPALRLRSGRDDR